MGRGAGIAFLCVAMALVGASGAFANPLDDYVAAPDSAYSWELTATYPHEGYTDYILSMNSQRWLRDDQVNQTLWHHWIVVTVPDRVDHSAGMLFIGGGSIYSAAPTANEPFLTSFAVQTHSVVAQLKQIPNEPLTFTGYRQESEDGLIAYGWKQFLLNGDPMWLMRLPMTKAAVRSMDTLTAFMASPEGGGRTLDRFVVSGASKRGWTTWTTAAVDAVTQHRVVGIAPCVIDVLNIDKSLRHHFDAYGFWSPAIEDYTDNSIMDWFGTPQMDALNAIEEPYSYRDRLTMPKLVVCATGDQFFLPDSSQFYFDRLKGEKRLLYVPNVTHGVEGPSSGLKEEAYQGMLSWYSAILNDVPRPEVTWYKRHDGALVIDTHGNTPTEALLWKATNPNARIFIKQLYGNLYTSTPLDPVSPGQYVASVETPAQGWTAFYAMLKFDSGRAEPFVFTTEVSVVPDVLPYGPQYTLGEPVPLLDDAFYAAAGERNAASPKVSSDGRRVAFWAIPPGTDQFGLFLATPGEAPATRRLLGDISMDFPPPLAWSPDDSAILCGQYRMPVPTPGQYGNPQIATHRGMSLNVFAATSVAADNYAATTVNGDITLLPILPNGLEDVSRQLVAVTDLYAAGVNVQQVTLSGDGSTLAFIDERVGGDHDTADVYVLRNLAAIVNAPLRDGTNVSSLAPTSLDDENLFRIRTVESDHYAGLPCLSNDGSMVYFGEDWNDATVVADPLGSVASTDFDVMVSYADGTEADARIALPGTQAFAAFTRNGARAVYCQPVDGLLRLFMAPLRTTTAVFSGNVPVINVPPPRSLDPYGSDGSATVNVPAGVTVSFPGETHAISIETPVLPEAPSRLPAGISLPFVRVIGPEDTAFSGNVTLALQYTDAEMARLDESALKVYRLNTGTNLYEEVASAGINHDPQANTVEIQVDRLGTYAIGAPMSIDADGDGLPDEWETAHGLNPGVDDAAEDPDGDGLTNLQEFQAGTDPHAADTDGDGWADGTELAAGSNPADAGSTPDNLPVTFADPALEAAVREALGKPFGSVVRQDMAGLTSLVASSRGIANLDGLQYASHLVHLSLDQNLITNLEPLSGLLELQELNLSWNRVADLQPLAGLTGLRQLHASANSITSVSALAGLTGLRELSLDQANRISDIAPLEGLAALETLNLDYNPFGDLSPLAGLTALQRLSCEHCEISDLSPLAGLTALRELRLNVNSASDLRPLAALPALQTLSLLQNGLVDLSPLAGITTLQWLHIGRNQVVDLSPLAGLTALQWLSADHNQISDLGPLAGLSSLQDLRIDYNPVSDLSALTGLVSLQALDLEHDQISDVTPLAGLVNLRDLDLAYNAVGNLYPLAGLINLQVLNLQGNGVSDLGGLAGMTALQTLDLAGNNVSDLAPLAGLMNLSGLTAFSNQIVDIAPLANLTNLQLLHLGNNRIGDLSPLAGLIGLQEVYLYNNCVADLSPLQNLTNLSRFYVSTNQVSDLSPLAGLTNLEVLVLHGNRVRDLSPLVGTGVMSSGDTLIIQRNPLSSQALCSDIPTLLGQGVTVYYDLSCTGDNDGDGLTDGTEGDLGLDPYNPDTDGDGLRDGDEVRDLDPATPGTQNPFDPLNADSTGNNGGGPDGIPDGSNDYDGDGVSNCQEILDGTSPLDPTNDPSHAAAVYALGTPVRVVDGLPGQFFAHIKWSQALYAASSVYGLGFVDLSSNAYYVMPSDGSLEPRRVPLSLTPYATTTTPVWDYTWGYRGNTWWHWTPGYDTLEEVRLASGSVARTFRDVPMMFHDFSPVGPQEQRYLSYLRQAGGLYLAAVPVASDGSISSGQVPPIALTAFPDEPDLVPYAARWATDAERIAFLQYHDVPGHPTTDLYVLRDTLPILRGQTPPVASLSDPRLAPIDSGASYYPNFSVDGRTVFFCKDTANVLSTALEVYSNYDQAELEIAYAPSDGGPVSVIAMPGDQVFANVSPDGNRIAYADNSSGTWDIYVAPLVRVGDYDTDGDGLLDADEATRGTDPNNPDTDGDGLTDGDEVRDLDPATPGTQNPFDPLDADSTGENGATGPDGFADGNNDWDGDGQSNAYELASGTNPLDPASLFDADGDGLAWSTFLGGTASPDPFGEVEDLPVDVQVDAQGYVYTAGYTISPDFPTTAGAFQVSPAGYARGFVSKFDPTGRTLVYSTFLGGTYLDLAAGIAVRPDGGVVVLGMTGSSDFPRVRPTLGGFNGGYDLFVARLAPEGDSLVFSTYLGGSGSEEVTKGSSLALDPQGNIFVTATTDSANFPITAGAYVPPGRGYYDACVAKISAGGEQLVFSTCLGGWDRELASALSVNAAGEATVVGYTRSWNYPTTPGALSGALSGYRDGFVTRLNASGSNLVYSTYLGGVGSENMGAVAADGPECVWLAGDTDSDDFPTTPGAFRELPFGTRDAFVAQLRIYGVYGGELMSSTRLGGSNTEMAQDLDFNADSVWVVGRTSSTDLITQAGFDHVYNGGDYDLYVVRLNRDLTQVTYGTYLGGSGREDNGSLALDGAGNAVVTGNTASSNFPVTPEAFDTTFGGTRDGFVVKLSGNLADTDNDGMPDGWEASHGLDPTVSDADADPDGDGLTNLQEYGAGTEPLTADTDGDGLADGVEQTTYGTNPLNADTDGDGLSDGQEVNDYATDPLTADTDGDGLVDALEIAHGCDPHNGDTDGDGLSDVEEVVTYGTNPTLADTDADGLLDRHEVRDLNNSVPGVQNPFNPLDRDSTGNNRSGAPDGIDDGDNDYDGDGVSNRDEFALGTDPIAVPQTVYRLGEPVRLWSGTAQSVLASLRWSSALYEASDVYQLGFVDVATRASYRMPADGSQPPALVCADFGVSPDFAWGLDDRTWWRSDPSAPFKLTEIRLSDGQPVQTVDFPSASRVYSPDLTRLSGTNYLTYTRYPLPSAYDGNIHCIPIAADGTAGSGYDPIRLSNINVPGMGFPGGILVPRWSPDGDRLVFEFEYAYQNQPHEIYLVQDLRRIIGGQSPAIADTEDPRIVDIWSGEGHAASPSFTSDGGHVFFTVDTLARFSAAAGNYGDAEFDIAFAPSDGSGTVRMLPLPGDQMLPALSPDGKKIAYVDNSSGTWDVYVANLVRFTDADLDGLSDAEEAELGTDPHNPDTDGDGLSDRDEVRDLDPAVPGVQNPFDPLNPDCVGNGTVGPDGTPDGANDWDGDGQSNAEECANGTNPFDATSLEDADGDGLAWSSFLGGASEDEVLDVEPAPGGLYVAGATTSGDFPTTAGAFQETSGAMYRGFLGKLDPTGSHWEFSTYFSGSVADYISDLDVAPDGSLVAVGITMSPDLPRAGSRYSGYRGDIDFFAARFSPDGTSLLASTYLGGVTAERDAPSVAVDAANGVWIAGATYALDYPVTAGAPYPGFGGGRDACVSRLSPGLDSLLFSTFLGGTMNDNVDDLAVDAAGNVCAVGATSSTDFPATTSLFGAESAPYPGGFAAVFRPSGELIFSSLTGGRATGVDCAPDGSWWLAGYSDWSALPTSPGAWRIVPVGPDVYIAHIDAGGTALLGTTFLGGSGMERANDVHVDASGTVWVAGYTESGDFPTTAGACDRTFNGVRDGFVASVAGTLDEVLYGTYLGGSSTESSLQLALGPADSVYAGGYTTSPDFPTTEGTVDRTYSGTSEGFVFKLAPRSLGGDADGDDMPDAWEDANGLNYAVNDAADDPDADGLTNLQEYRANTNPHAADTDGDGLTDAEEVLTFGTDPTRADTDGDGLGDRQETVDLDPATPGLQNPYNPTAGDSTGNNGAGSPDGVLDGRNDYDGDGVSNADELAEGTNPLDPSDRAARAETQYVLGEPVLIAQGEPSQFFTHLKWSHEAQQPSGVYRVGFGDLDGRLYAAPSDGSAAPALVSTQVSQWATPPTGLWDYTWAYGGETWWRLNPAFGVARHSLQEQRLSDGAVLQSYTDALGGSFYPDFSDGVNRYLAYVPFRANEYIVENNVVAVPVLSNLAIPTGPPVALTNFPTQTTAVPEQLRWAANAGRLAFKAGSTLYVLRDTLPILQRSAAGPAAFDDPRLVPIDSGCVQYPSFSPDGRTVFYTKDLNGVYPDVLGVSPEFQSSEFDIAYAPADGGEVRTIALPGDQIFASVSPDGMRVAYADNVAGAWNVYVASIVAAAPVSGTTAGAGENGAPNDGVNDLVVPELTQVQDGSNAAVTLASGAVVDFPADAPQEITIATPVNPPAPEQLPVGVAALPVVREFGPEGTQFYPPAVVTFTYTDPEIAGLDEATLRLFRFNDATGLYDIEVPAADIVERDLLNNRIRFRVDHFSTYGLGGAPEGANRAPVLAAIGDRTVAEGDTLMVAVSASDDDGDALSLSAVGLPEGALFVDNGDGTALLVWTTGFDDAGTYAGVTIQVTDSASPALTDSETFTIGVTDVNRPPVLSYVGDAIVTEGAETVAPVSAFDPDGDPVVLSATGLPAFASLVDNGNGTGWLHFAPGYADARTYGGIVITVTDTHPSPLSDSETINITVLDANRPPVLSPIGARSVEENTTIEIAVAASDPDGTAPSLAAAPLPEGATFTDHGNGTGVFVWTPGYDAAHPAPYAVTFVADDGGLAVSETVEITVLNVNRAPGLAAVGPVSVEEGAASSVVVSATDPDGDPVTLVASALPAFATFADNGDGKATLTLNPGYDAAGTYAGITVTATDGGTPPLNDAETFVITVTNVPHPPNAPVVAGTSPTSDTTPTWTWTSGGGGGNALFRYRLDEAGAWTEASTASYTPATALTAGAHTLEVQEQSALDANDWSASGRFTIVIETVPGAGRLWGCTYGAHSEIFRVDTTTGALIAYADLGALDFTDIAVDPSEAFLYVVYPGTDSSRLSQIDATSLAIRQTWAFPAGVNVNALSWKTGTADTLYGIEDGGADTSALYEIVLGPAGPSVRKLGEIPAGASDGDLAEDPATGSWYGTFAAGGGSQLWTVDVSSPEASVAASTLTGCAGVGGLEFDGNGTLWGATLGTPELFRIQPTSPTATVTPAWDLGETLQGDGIAGLARSKTLVRNGGFELGTDPGSATKLSTGSTAINDWAVLPKGAYYIGTYYQAAGGTRSVKLTTHVTGAVSQTLQTVPGQSYMLTFSMAGDPYPYLTPEQKIKELTVTVAGKSQDFRFDVTGRSVGNMGWETRSWRFRATAAETTLVFATKTPAPYGPVIDNVSVVPVRGELLWGVTNGLNDAGPGTGGQIFTFDTATGAVTVKASYGPPLKGFGDIAVRDTGEIYVTYQDSADGFDKLAKVNPVTWAFDWVRDLGGATPDANGVGQVNALEFVGGNLLGVTAGPTANLLQIKPNGTGATVTLLGSLGANSEGDLAENSAGTVYYTNRSGSVSALNTVTLGPPPALSARLLDVPQVGGLAFDRYGVLWAARGTTQSLYTVNACYPALAPAFDASATLGGAVEGMSRPGRYDVVVQLANGSFESGVNPGSAAKLNAGSTAIDGWTVGGKGIYYVGTYYQAAEGARCVKLTLQKPGSIEQTLDTVPGRTYEVAFSMAGDPYPYLPADQKIKTLEISARDAGGLVGAQQFTFNTTGRSVSNMGWESHTWTFTAASTQTALRFTSISPGPYGPCVDDIRVREAE